MNESVRLEIDNFYLEGILNIPENAKGIVLFVHGSSSSKLSPRNQYVAHELNRNEIATLLIDLLTSEEDSVYENRFDIKKLTQRVIKILNWIRKEPKLQSLKIGLFGASTGAASLLNAVIKNSENIYAIVIRGGRPDLCSEDVSLLKIPSLFILGELDEEIIQLNQLVFNRILCDKKFKIIPDATHLFEEPGRLEKVAKSAMLWFKKFFV
jgi:putative phosphoribosyl transferase